MNNRLRTNLLILSFILPLSANAQIEWQRVDQTAEGPIDRAFVWDMETAPDGTPLVVAGDGMYRIEGGAGTLRAVRTDSLLIGWFLESWGEQTFMATRQAIFRSDDDGRNWGRVWGWEDRLYPSHQIVVVGENLVAPTPSGDSVGIIDPSGTTLQTYQLPRRIRSLAATAEGTLFLLGSGGTPAPIYRSSDTGRTWDSIPTVWPASFRGAYDFRALSDDLLAINAISGPDVISRDGGLSFDTVTNGEPFPLRRLTDDRLVALQSTAVDSFTYLLSTDFGLTWEPCPPSFPTVTFIGRDGTKLWAGEPVPALSKECGDPFVPIDEGFRNVQVFELMENAGTFYARMSTGHFRSIDGGITWTPIDPFFHLDRSGNLYARHDSTGTITVDGLEEDARWTTLRISHDRGETWRHVFDEPFLSTDERPNFLIRSNGNRGVMIYTWTGLRQWEPIESDLRYSDDGGRSFTVVGDWNDTGLFRPFDFELTGEGRVIATGGRYDEEGDYIDFGVNSIDIATGEAEWFGGPDFNFLHVGASGSVWGWRQQRIYRSDDGGRSWADAVLTAELSAPNELIEKGEGFLFMSNQDRSTIFLSRDRGETWEEFDPETPWDIPNPPAENGFPLPNEVLSDGTIITRVHVDRKDPWFGTPEFYHYYTLGISADGGRTWEYPVGDLLDRKDVTTVVWSERERTLLVGTRDNGLYRAVIPSGVGEVPRVPLKLDLR